jgi:hypothetical protein
VKLRRKLAWQLKVALALMAIMGVLGSVLARGDVTAREVTAPLPQAVTPTSTPVPPKLNVSPTSSLLPNDILIVTGTGFTTGGSASIVSITIGGVRVPVEKINFGNSVQVSNAGTFDTTVIIPVNSTTLTTGSHTATALDSGGRTASITVSFQRRALKIDPQSGRRSSSVTVTGTGFPASSTQPGAEVSPSIQIRYEIAGRDPRRIASALANASGEFTTSFSVPLDAPIPSGNIVRVVIAGHESSETETKTHSVPDRTIKVSPDNGPSGISIMVTGSNFPAFTQVRSLTIGRIQALPSPAPATDAEGSFTASAVVPDLALGTQPVALEVGDTTALISFRVTTPPATPQPASPAGVAANLAPLGANLVRVWGFDAKIQAFQLYDPAAPRLSDLTALVRTRGYWILVNRNQIVTLGSSSYDLSAGWNLIGWVG